MHDQLEKDTSTSPRTVAKELFPSIAKKIEELSKVKKFWATRKKVLQARALADLSSTNFEQAGLMGPWGFNLYESTLATIPAFILANVGTFLWGSRTEPHVALSESQSFQQKTFALLFPFVYPITLLLVGSIAGWAALRRKNRSPQLRHQCTRAYLYFEGAYGFLAELSLLTLVGFSIAINFDSDHGFEHGWGIPLFIVFMICLLWNSALSLYLVPRKLFIAIGYPRLKSTIGPPVQDGPWWKYRFLVLTCGGHISVLVYCALLLAAMVVTVAVFALKGLVVRG